MNRSFDFLIKPILEEYKFKHIVEIGAFKGENTEKIIKLCKSNNTKLSVVDPFPLFNTFKLRKTVGEFDFYEELSLDALKKIKDYDVILLDGDHNYYTVSRELELIYENNDTFPLVFFHDVAWPYARRDMYYNIDNIPEEHRNECEISGLDIEIDELTPGGINPHLLNAKKAFTEKNGVLTAIEDFLKGKEDFLLFDKVEIYNGIGVICSAENKALIDRFNELANSKELIAILEREINFLKSKRSVYQYNATNKINLLEKQIMEFKAGSEKLKVDSEKLKADSEKLKENTEKLSENNEKLKENNENLKEISEKLKENTEKLKADNEKLKLTEIELTQNNLSLNEVIKSINKNLDHKEKELLVQQNEIDELNVDLELKSIQVEKTSAMLNKSLKNEEIYVNIIRDSVSSNSPIDYIKKYYQAYKIFKSKEFDCHYYRANYGDEYRDEIDKYVSMQNNKILSTLFRNTTKALNHPIRHFVFEGADKGLNPNKTFTTIDYFTANQDVLKSPLNPFYHYIKYGQNEGRICNIKSEYPLVDTIKPRQEKRKINSSLLFSVVMPTFNRVNCIDKAIDSILQQSYINFEIIIVDDGSTDNTRAHLEARYKDEIKSKKIIYIQENHKGVSNARNVALQNAKGDIICYLDTDNEWIDGYLEKLYHIYTNTDVKSTYAGININDKTRNRYNDKIDTYNRIRLLDHNFIDMNVYSHKIELFENYGGFDLELKRLVDWDLIIRYTKYAKPFLIREIYCKYYIDDTLKNITNTVPLANNKKIIHNKHIREKFRYGQAELNIAYILWDYPAFSQTFVHSEIDYLIENGYNVTVFYKIEPEKGANLKNKVKAIQVENSEILAKELLNHEINIMHSHFVYPAGTLLVYEASQMTGINYTIATHAVDIFHQNNVKRNKVKEISYDDKCIAIFTDGTYHRQFLIDQGVLEHKIVITKQAVDIEVMPINEICANLQNKIDKKGLNKFNIICVARFIEKKGIEYLIRSAQYLAPDKFEINIYGYGPLEDDYKKIIAELNLINVNIQLPIENREEYEKILKDADAMVMPCTRAENGDMDGIPTVILEAMSLGLPVISTDVSSIADVVIDTETGFIVEDKSYKQVAEKIIELSDMEYEDVCEIVSNAATIISENLGVKKTTELNIQYWSNKRVTLLMVTYCRNNEDLERFKSVFNNVLEHTNSYYKLLIYDNNSDFEFIEYLREIEQNHNFVEVVFGEENIFCGNASNVLFDMVETEYAMYICSNEGMILDLNFVDYCANYMDTHKDVAMGGTLATSSKFFSGKTYQDIELFEHFRNKEFAIENEDRLFKHIQGGLYILRMSVYKKVGGFNKDVYHNFMDVEYSMYLESLGYKLGDIEGLIAGTLKTLPAPITRVEFNTMALHPVVPEKAELLRAAKAGNRKICLHCSTLNHMDSTTCVNCQIDYKQERILESLSTNNFAYRNIKLFIENTVIDKKYIPDRMYTVVDKECDADLVASNWNKYNYTLVDKVVDIFIYEV